MSLFAFLIIWSVLVLIGWKRHSADAYNVHRTHRYYTGGVKFVWYSNVFGYNPLLVVRDWLDSLDL